jgi:hypothetical protein
MRSRVGTWTRSIAGAIGGGAGALLLAGCGGGFADESAGTIADEALQDMKGLSSLTMTGTLSQGGQKLSLDLGLTTSGDCAGSIGTPAGKARFVSLGKRGWIKADTSFWVKNAGIPAEQVEQVIGDKYVALPPSANDFSQVCDLDALLAQMDKGAKGKGSGDKVSGTEDVDGQEAVVLKGKSGKGGGSATIWVAVDDPHYVLKLRTTGGKEPGTIRFSNFDAAPAVKAPPASKVADLSNPG